MVEEGYTLCLNDDMSNNYVTKAYFYMDKGKECTESYCFRILFKL